MRVCVFNTFTDSGFLVEGIASWTFTLKTAKGVDAVSSLTQSRQLLTLIDVWQRKRERKHSVALTAGVIRASTGGKLTQTHHSVLLSDLPR